MPLRLLSWGEPSTVLPVKALSVPACSTSREGQSGLTSQAAGRAGRALPLLALPHEQAASTPGLKGQRRTGPAQKTARLACNATCRWKSVSGAAAAMRSSTVRGVMSYPDPLIFRGAPGWLGCQPAPALPPADLLLELPIPEPCCQ